MTVVLKQLDCLALPFDFLFEDRKAFLWRVRHHASPPSAVVLILTVVIGRPVAGLDPGLFGAAPLRSLCAENGTHAIEISREGAPLPYRGAFPLQWCKRRDKRRTRIRSNRDDGPFGQPPAPTSSRDRKQDRRAVSEQAGNLDAWVEARLIRPDWL